MGFLAGKQRTAGRSMANQHSFHGRAKHPPPPARAHVHCYTARSLVPDVLASLYSLPRRPQHGSQRWDDGRTPEEALKDLGVSRISPRDASRLHSELRAAQVNVVASRMKWAALLKETDTVSGHSSYSLGWVGGLMGGWMSWPGLMAVGTVVCERVRVESRSGRIGMAGSREWRAMAHSLDGWNVIFDRV